jgi:hypothetical protein
MCIVRNVETCAEQCHGAGTGIRGLLKIPKPLLVTVLIPDRHLFLCKSHLPSHKHLTVISCRCVPLEELTTVQPKTFPASYGS